MARTAKRYQEMNEPFVNETIVPRFNVGIYSRLSVDHNDKKSESIENQIEIMKQYIVQNNRNPKREMDLVIYKEYIDRGVSGTTFERDAFEELMSDVKKKFVSCIIVKDFSRFGRDYIEAGNLIEKILPFLGVRFIAVTDGFDSMSKDAANGKLAMNIKNLVNDMYAKDISKRVSIARRQSVERGSFVGSFAPYGYKVVNDNGFRYLEVNTEAAKIIKSIFVSYAAGATPDNIVQLLYEKRVHRISDYNKYDHVYCQGEEPLYQWNPFMITQVIRNRTYAGDMIQGKHVSKLYEGQKGVTLSDPEEWVIVENAHEAIVSKKLFQLANEKIPKMAMCERKERKNAIKYVTEENIFCNVIYCGACEGKMKATYYQSRITEKRNYAYHCHAAYYKDERKCTRVYITQDQLEDKVRAAMKEVFGELKLKAKQITEINSSNCKEKQKQYQKEMEQLNDDRILLKKKFGIAYMQMKDGKIRKEEYLLQKKNKEAAEDFYDKRIADLEKKINHAGIRAEEENKFLRSLVKADNSKNLNKELVDSLIDKIMVNPDLTLTITFKFNERR